MAKQPKKAKQNIKDLQVDDTAGATVKGGQAQLPTRTWLAQKLNKTFLRPKS